MTRLFIGTIISEQDQERIRQVQEKKTDLEDLWNRKVRWVKPEKVHLTWLFLGTVGSDLVQPITELFANLVVNELSRTSDRAPMKLVFDHAELWPDAKKPRQVVLRPSEVEPRIAKLASVLRTGLLEFYFEQSLKEEMRTFKPHLTMLRIERRQESVKFTRTPSSRIKLSEVQGLSEALPIVLELDKIALIESHLGKSDTYTVLHEVATAPAI